MLHGVLVGIGGGGAGFIFRARGVVRRDETYPNKINKSRLLSETWEYMRNFIEIGVIRFDIMHLKRSG
jgi:hypothetical protein